MVFCRFVIVCVVFLDLIVVSFFEWVWKVGFCSCVCCWLSRMWVFVVIELVGNCRRNCCNVCMLVLFIGMFFILLNYILVVILCFEVDWVIFVR